MNALPALVSSVRQPGPLNPLSSSLPGSSLAASLQNSQQRNRAGGWEGVCTGLNLTRHAATAHVMMPMFLMPVDPDSGADFLCN
jgi:hypothetical protein